MTNKEVRKLFFHFLKKEGIYVKYMRLFNFENEKPQSDRFNLRPTQTIIEFLTTENPSFWIVRPFTWPSSFSGTQIHDKWIEYYETTKYNLNNVADSNG